VHLSRPTTGLFGANGLRLDRRSLLITAPAALAAVAASSTGDTVLSPFGAAGAQVADKARDVASRAAAPAGQTPTVPSSSRAALEQAVVQAMGGRSQVISVCVLDRRTGAKWNYRGGALQRTGSVAKAFIVTAALRKARAAGTSLTAAQLDQARLAITRSDNAAATSLYTWIGGHAGIVSVTKAVGLVMTPNAPASSSWGTTLTSSNDLVTFMQALHVGHAALHPSDRAVVLDLMSKVIGTQRWGVGSVPAGNRVRNKNGWMAVGNPWVINSFGDVRGNGRDYALALMQTRQPDQHTGIARAELIGRAVYDSLARPFV
jgi:beta-lactamase class A